MPPGYQAKGYEDNVRNKPQDMTQVRPPGARSSSPEVPESAVGPRKSRPADMTTVRTMGGAAPAVGNPKARDMTQVRPPDVAGASMKPSSGRVSIPSAGEINKQVKRKKGGMLALYWAAGIVAMLTAGGILTAMIARGDADKLMNKSAPPTASAGAAPVAAPAAPGAVPTDPKAAAAASASALAAASAKKPDTTKGGPIPGAKPGTIVNLELWKKAGRGDPGLVASANAASPPPTTSSGKPAPKVLTPDNDPAVKLARDQLEATFK